ncbi:MAG: TerB family tellurite resistance protein [Alphaproteobacteria bacterium]|nr:TerB family tellurite resistance protein [Alphaproteobacteria bacterium]
MMTENTAPNRIGAATTSHESSRQALADIVEKMSSPNGFSKLTPKQRSLLLAAVLSSVVPADGLVRAVEMQHLEKHLTTKFQFARQSLSEALDLARRTHSQSGIEVMAKHLPELLSIEDRIQLIGMLWDIALCDQELHQNEETLIYKLADAVGVMRKRVVEQQAIAASRNGIKN